MLGRYPGRSRMVLLLHHLDRLAWLPYLRLSGKLMCVRSRLHVLVRVRRCVDMLLWVVLLLLLLLLLLDDNRLTRVVMRWMASMQSVHLCMASRKASRASEERPYGQSPQAN